MSDKLSSSGRQFGTLQYNFSNKSYLQDDNPQVDNSGDNTEPYDLNKREDQPTGSSCPIMEKLALFPNGCSKQLQISAYTLEEAYYSRYITPDDISKDNEAVNPAHKDHTNISWVNCYTHTCKDHAQEKVENAMYPLHTGLVPMPYWDYKTQPYKL